MAPKLLKSDGMLVHVHRPFRLVWRCFLGLSAFVSVFLPFMTNELPPKAWPFMYGYCALLSVVTVGLLRLNRSAILLVAAPVLLAVIPRAIGIALMLRPGAIFGEGGRWLLVSLYLWYAAGVWVICFVLKGWSLYFKDRRNKPV
jgi:hypothetical protein